MSDLKQLGRYQVEARLGSGATADVYRALDTSLNRVVALKILKPHLTADPGAFTRFMREAQAAANLLHPHIAWVFDVGQEQGFTYLATRYIAGPSLAGVLKERGRLPWVEALSITQQVAAALDFAHQQNLIHRDVKPHNILIGANEGAVLTDFGLVRAVQSGGQTSQTGLGAALGTLHYIAPEILRNQQITPAADQYALACVVSEMLSGARLYDADEIFALMYKHSMPPEFPNPWPADVPAGVEAVLAKALAIEPGERYPSVGAFAAALGERHHAQPAPADNDASGAPDGRTLPEEAHAPVETRPEPHPAGNVTPRLPVDVQPKPAPEPAGYAPPVEARPEPTPELPTQPQPTTTGDGDAQPPAEMPGEAASKQLPEAAPPGSGSGAAWPPARRTGLLRWITLGALAILVLVALGATFAYLKPARISARIEKDAQVTRLVDPGQASIHQIAWSPDGRQIAVAVSNGVYMVGVAGQAEAIFVDTHARVTSVAFSPDGRTLALGSLDFNVRVWDLASWKTTLLLEGHTSTVTSVAYAPDGRTLASGSLDNTVLVWNAGSGALLRELVEQASDVNSLAFSPDGKLLASGADNGIVRVYDTSSWRVTHLLTFHKSAVASVAFSPDGQMLASGSEDNTVRVWQVADGFPLYTLEQHISDVNSVAFSPDGKLLASASDDNAVRVWDASNWRLLYTLDGHTADVNSVAFSPDGLTLASGAQDGTLRLWPIPAP